VASCPECLQTVEEVVKTEDKGFTWETPVGRLAEEAAGAAWEFLFSYEHDWYSPEQRKHARDRALKALKAWEQAK